MIIKLETINNILYTNLSKSKVKEEFISLQEDKTLAKLMFPTYWNDLTRRELPEMFVSQGLTVLINLLD